MKTALVLALAGLMSTANAQSPMRDDTAPRMQQKMEGTPGLDDATAAKIEQLRADHQKAAIALRAKMKAAQVDFRMMMQKDNPDESAILSKQKEISGIRGELAASRLKHQFAVRKLLTPEQQKLFRKHGARGIGQGRGMGDRGRGFRGNHGRHRTKFHRGARGEGSCCR